MGPKPVKSPPTGDLLPGFFSWTDVIDRLLQKKHWLVVCFNRKGRRTAPLHKSEEQLLGGFLDRCSEAWGRRAARAPPPAPGGDLPYLFLLSGFEHPYLERFSPPLTRALDVIVADFLAGALATHLLRYRDYELIGHLVPDRQAFDSLKEEVDNRLAPEKLPPPGQGKEGLAALKALERELAKAQAPLIAKFHRWLAAAAGTVPETYEEAVRVIDAIKRFARLAGQQLLHNRRPVSLQCVRAPRSIRASIQARGRAQGRTRVLYVGTAIPPLTSEPLS